MNKTPWRTVVQYRRGVICPADCGYYAQEIVTEGSDEGTIICTNCGHTRATVVDDAPHHHPLTPDSETGEQA